VKKAPEPDVRMGKGNEVVATKGVLVRKNVVKTPAKQLDDGNRRKALSFLDTLKESFKTQVPLSNPITSGTDGCYNAGRSAIRTENLSPSFIPESCLKGDAPSAPGGVCEQVAQHGFTGGWLHDPAAKMAERQVEPWKLRETRVGSSSCDAYELQNPKAVAQHAIPQVGALKDVRIDETTFGVGSDEHHKIKKGTSPACIAFSDDPREEAKIMSKIHQGRTDAICQNARSAANNVLPVAALSQIAASRIVTDWPQQQSARPPQALLLEREKTTRLAVQNHMMQDASLTKAYSDYGSQADAVRMNERVHDPGHHMGSPASTELTAELYNHNQEFRGSAKEEATDMEITRLASGTRCDVRLFQQKLSACDGKLTLCHL
jgi:hypothetical protein